MFLGNATTSTLGPIVLTRRTSEVKSPSPETKTTTSSLGAMSRMSSAISMSQSPFMDPSARTFSVLRRTSMARCWSMAMKPDWSISLDSTT